MRHHCISGHTQCFDIMVDICGKLYRTTHDTDIHANTQIHIHEHRHICTHSDRLRSTHTHIHTLVETIGLQLKSVDCLLIVMNDS